MSLFIKCQSLFHRLIENTKDTARIFVSHAMSFMTTTIGNYE